MEALHFQIKTDTKTIIAELERILKLNTRFQYGSLEKYIKELKESEDKSKMDTLSENEKEQLQSQLQKVIETFGVLNTVYHLANVIEKEGSAVSLELSDRIKNIYL